MYVADNYVSDFFRLNSGAPITILETGSPGESVNRIAWMEYSAAGAAREITASDSNMARRKRNMS